MCFILGKCMNKNIKSNSLGTVIITTNDSQLIERLKYYKSIQSVSCSFNIIFKLNEISL